MFRSLILAAVLLASAPMFANAGEITLLPSIKLQIGDRDNYGNYWMAAAGATAITGINTGIATTTAGTAVGINVIKPTNVAIATVGATVMTIVDAGAVMDTDMVATNFGYSGTARYA